MDKKKVKKEIARAMTASLKNLGFAKAGKKAAKIIERAAAKLAQRLDAATPAEKKKKPVKKAKRAAKKKSAAGRKPTKKSADFGISIAS